MVKILCACLIFCCVGFMVYYFCKAVFKHVLWRVVVSVIIGSLIGLWILSGLGVVGKTVRIRENVLYVLPASDSIYDGSKNDPNLR